MKTKRRIFATIVCLLTGLACQSLVAAQEKRAAPEAEAGQSKALSDTFKVLSYKMSAGAAKAVKGAPYSATAVTESIQTLTDGNQIIQRKEAAYYRDGEGRTRVDERLDMIGNWTAAGEPPRMTIISDPVAGVFYNLDPRTHTALKMSQASPSRFEGEAGAQKRKQVEAQMMKAGAEKNEAGSKSNLGGAPKPIAAAKDALTEETKKTPLGKQTIEGIDAEGTLINLTIPPGQIGNTLPIEIVDEQWYSPELQIIVMTKHRDPRSGELSWRLTNINRSEPDRALFQVPADYKIVDNTPGLKMKTEQE